MKKIILFVLAFPVLLFSEDWESHFTNLTNKDISQIENGEYAYRARTSYKDGLELLPNLTELTDEFKAAIASYNPELCVEMLYVLDHPELDFDTDTDTDEDDLMILLLNNLRAFSDQKGLEYYSFNRERMYPLIKDSYFLSSNKKNKVDDPVVSSLPEFEKLYYSQNDTTFGKNEYSLITRSKGNSLWLQMENLKKLTVMGLFKAIDKGGVRTNFFIYKLDDKILMYTLAEIKEEPNIKKVLMFKVNIPGSFKRRMSTIVDWFKGRIY
ncbi:MAG: hypothetical protein B6229_00565 [Spirochaetaceae bacterium 4572_7]|nr:MAG: hypothetical protein B6229_00565 [Spirochaetaceae bacterium 4572_7]